MLAPWLKVSPALSLRCIPFRFSRWYCNCGVSHDDSQTYLGEYALHNRHQSHSLTHHARMSLVHFLPTSLNTVLESFSIARSLCHRYPYHRCIHLRVGTSRPVHYRVSIVALSHRDRITMKWHITRSLLEMTIGCPLDKGPHTLAYTTRMPYYILPGKAPFLRGVSQQLPELP